MKLVFLRSPTILVSSKLLFRPPILRAPFFSITRNLSYSNVIRNKVNETSAGNQSLRKELNGKSTLPTSSSNGILRSRLFLKKIPNLITVSRIACTPLIGYYMFANNITPALYLFLYCCATDFLDGFLARKYNLKTVAGTVLDPMADKILMVVTTISLTFAPGPQIVPISIASLILGRDLALGITALFIRFKSMKLKYTNFTWKNYWDFFHFPSVEVKPTLISKWNTFLQMIYLAYAVVILITEEPSQSCGENNPNEEDKKNPLIPLLHSGFKYMGYIVGTTTALSGASYIFSKNAVRLVK